MKKIIALLALVAATGCSSVIEGTSQEIMVNTNPAGAACKLEREGAVIANIPETPAATTIKKTKHDITIRCNKPGYEEATYLNHSGAAGVAFVNVIWWPGAIVDSAAGADNKYDSPVNITLVPKK